MNTFNNRFINNWKELSKSTIGLEFEFYSNHSYVKTLELLNNLFDDDIHVWGFNSYHSNFTPTNTDFKIEPDFSGGSDMIELVTGPLNWADARVIVISFLTWLQKNGYTDEHCSIHVNVSFTDLQIIDMKPVKLILNFNEDYVYEKFPNRRNNIYARSIKWIMPFENYISPESGMTSILTSLILPDDTKYYGINLQKKIKNYLEFRYIGGENYEYKYESVLDLMDYFVIQTKKAILEDFDQYDLIKLNAYLEENINWVKKYKTYDLFLANIDKITITVDKDDDYVTVKMNWDKFNNKLFDIIKNSEKLENVIINYNTITSRLEIVDGIISGLFYVNFVDFVDCRISDSNIYNCDFIDCVIDTTHIYNSNIYETKISNSKIENSKCLEFSELIKCMFNGGILDCSMKDGVFRSGQLGPNADIESTVKMFNNEDSFWRIEPNNKKITKLKNDY